MVAVRERQIVGQKPEERVKLPEYKGPYLTFEGVRIQWEKGSWPFYHPTLGRIEKPTYPLLNPKHWDEIVERLKRGETAAGYMMGNFGVFKVLEALQWEKVRKSKEGSADALFDKVKKRPREQNFVALAHPEDIIDLIDLDKIEEPFRNELRYPEGRFDFYTNPVHRIYPVRNSDLINPALVRQSDNTIACYFVPKHYGFEGLIKAARKKIKHGILGGASLNVHGDPPPPTKQQLYERMANNPEWLEEIDFVIFDDISEEVGVGRSGSMIGHNGEVIRIGSVSVEKINRGNEEKIKKDPRFQVFIDREKFARGEIKFATSTTQYNKRNNALVDQRIDEVLSRIQRLEKWINASFGYKKESLFDKAKTHFDASRPTAIQGKPAA